MQGYRDSFHKRTHARMHVRKKRSDIADWSIPTRAIDCFQADVVEAPFLGLVEIAFFSNGGGVFVRRVGDMRKHICLPDWCPVRPVRCTECEGEGDCTECDGMRYLGLRLNTWGCDERRQR